MRAFLAGILSLEEPKRAVSPSGNYSSSYGDGTASITINNAVVSATDLSLMMWIKPSANGKVFASNANTLFEIRSDGKIRFRHLTTNATYNTVISSTAITLNEWSNVCVTGNSTDGLKVYINGIEDGSNVWTADLDVASDLTIGGAYLGSYGIIRIWDRVLDSAEVAKHYAWDGEDPLTAGAVAVSAMTDAQKVGLNLAIEGLQDNPYDGSEYSDLSGQGNSISVNNVQLIGDDLQIYTNIADIPSGGATIFDVDTIDLDGTSQYLELQGDASRLNIGTQTLAVSGWVYVGGGNKHLYRKGSIQNENDRDVTYQVLSSGEIRIQYNTVISSNSNQQLFICSTLASSGWNHIVIYDNMASRTSTPKMYLNGVDISGGSWTIDDIDRTSYNWDSLVPYELGSFTNLSGDRFYRGTAHFTGIAIGQELTQSDATYLYNNGIPQCFDEIDPSISSKFDAFFDNGRYNGSSELQALTDKVNGWQLTNVNDAPFIDQGLQIECDEEPRSLFDVDTIDLDGTSQYLELQGDASRLNIGTDTLAVSGWVNIVDGSSIGVFNKYNATDRGWFGLMNSSSLSLILRTSTSDNLNWEASASISLANGWHHFIIYWDRSSRSNPPVGYVDGQAVSMTITKDQADPTNVNFDNSLTYQIGGNRSGGSQNYYDSIPFHGVVIGQELTQADATYLYNNGIPQCFDEIDPSISSKFNAFFDNGTYNGRTELQALTDRVNGWILDNVNNAPFVDQGLQVEC